MHRLTLSPGTTIYAKGEAAQTAYLILEGTVTMERGGLRVTAEKSALIGFSGLFDRPYGSTAVAHSDCTLLAFSRRELRNLIHSNPGEAMAIIDGMLNLLGRVADALEQRADG